MDSVDNLELCFALLVWVYEGISIKCCELLPLSIQNLRVAIHQADSQESNMRTSLNIYIHSIGLDGIWFDHDAGTFPMQFESVEEENHFRNLFVSYEWEYSAIDFPKVVLVGDENNIM